MRAKALYSLVLILSLFSLIAFADQQEHGFVIAPQKLVFDLKHPDTQELILKNTGTKLIHLQVSVEHFPFEDKTHSKGVSLVENRQDNLKDYVLFSPHVVSLFPGQQRYIRVFARMPKDVKPGTYRADLLAHMVEPAQVQVTEKDPKSGKHLVLNMKLMIQMAIPIYAEFGNNEAKLDITCHKDSTENLELDAINKTPYHFSGEVFISKLSDKKKILVSSPMVVMRESQHTVTVNFKPEPHTPYFIEYKPSDDRGQGLPGSTVCEVS